MHGSLDKGLLALRLSAGRACCGWWSWPGSYEHATLLEAGRRHSLIPLSGITHRPVDPVAAENMLRIEVEFLQRALGITASAGG